MDALSQFMVSRKLRYEMDTKCISRQGTRLHLRLADYSLLSIHLALFVKDDVLNELFGRLLYFKACPRRCALLEPTR